MELSQTETRFFNKWKKPLTVAAIVLGLVLLALIYLASSAEAQTQSVTYNLSWTNGAVAPDGSNRPDTTIIQQRVRNAGQTTFTPWADIGSVNFPIATFQDKIEGDPGGRTICYQVAHRNTAGTSAFTPEACVVTPVLRRIPSTPNNAAPVIIIIGPVTVQP